MILFDIHFGCYWVVPPQREDNYTQLSCKIWATPTFPDVQCNSQHSLHIYMVSYRSKLGQWSSYQLFSHAVIVGHCVVPHCKPHCVNLIGTSVFRNKLDPESARCIPDPSPP